MRLRLLTLAMVLVVLFIPLQTHPVAAAPTPLCFNVSAIVNCVDPQFRPYWEANGGLPVFGYPLTPAQPQQTADGLWMTQHFERNRLELHPDAPEPFKVEIGRLGADALQQVGRDWHQAATGSPQNGCRYFAETKHTVCEPFLSYWRTHGLDLGDAGVSDREALALWGLPLTEARRERNSSGDEVVTQWFERARFEDHGAAGVLLGRLGAEVDAKPSIPAPAAGWVQVQGNQLVVAGQPVHLKGVNYYPALHPWAFMWTQWDGPAVDHDLGRMEHELGANTVRVLVPYSRQNGWSDDNGHVRPAMLDELRQFVQLAGNHHVKVIVTLFDWHYMLQPSERSSELAYLTTIVQAFRDDDRILAWDIHNEPDNYDDWKLDPTATVSWVTSVADVLHALDPRHPVTVGAGSAAALLKPGRDGRTMLDVSDIVSVHNYDASQYSTILQDLAGRTAKPILLEEFGWPSGPECIQPFHDEPSQLYLFQQAGAALHLPSVVGGLSWWFQDSALSAYNPTDSENNYFGLFRKDGSAKPAALALASWQVAPLSSQSLSSVALTTVPPAPPDPLNAPLQFGDLILVGSFKFFWLFFGGEPTFGKPITQPYRQADGTMVQYFEHARFELNESVHVQPIDPNWAEGQTDAVYLDRVHLTSLGSQFTAGRSWPPVSDPGQPDVIWSPATGHTIRGPFRTLWLTHKALFFGEPLSEQIVETINGQPVTVQYFEKWRMELQADGTVRLGALGQDALSQRPCQRGW
ncbi:MAG: cellulase family glycosylhydrolase [Herpetosiphonaceae bacterium]|nr:cellulase family glycosylhydrolase [Herpetosiphonaceae bacterium]